MSEVILLPEELQKIDKEQLEDIYSEHFDIDEILETELEEIKQATMLIEAKIIALQHHRRILKNA